MWIGTKLLIPFGESDGLTGITGLTRSPEGSGGMGKWSGGKNDSGNGRQRSITAAKNDGQSVKMEMKRGEDPNSRGNASFPERLACFGHLRPRQTSTERSYRRTSIDTLLEPNNASNNNYS